MILIFFLINGYSQNIPEEFYGIWESKDRYVFIEKNETEKANQIVIYLKTYYGWYVDRTVEPKEYDEKVKELNVANARIDHNDGNQCQQRL